MKTDKEKFAGADYTLTVEAFLPSGKAAQGATSHLLGQNFAKAFEIDYLDKNEKKQFVWQTSWGISTRSVGVAIMMHSDDKGLVVSPRVAEKQIVVVPIFGKKDKDARKKVMGKVNEIVSELGDVRVLVDDSDNSPGYKFNEWEMKGVPLRLEFGMRDLDSGKVVLVRRDNGKKEEVKFKNVSNRVAELLEDIHGSLYNKAKKFLRDNTVEVSGMKELVKVIENKKLVVAKWDGSLESEDMIKDKSGGGKILCIRKEVSDGKCVYSGKKAKYEVYVGKSY
jgi:prolyl-tRNA synthetase